MCLVFKCKKGFMFLQSLISFTNSVVFLCILCKNLLFCVFKTLACMSHIFFRAANFCLQHFQSLSRSLSIVPLPIHRELPVAQFSFSFTNLLCFSVNSVLRLLNQEAATCGRGRPHCRNRTKANANT